MKYIRRYCIQIRLLQNTAIVIQLSCYKTPKESASRTITKFSMSKSRKGLFIFL